VLDFPEPLGPSMATTSGRFDSVVRLGFRAAWYWSDIAASDTRFRVPAPCYDTVQPCASIVSTSAPACSGATDKER
jgi:hypothetical protein